MSSAQDRAIAQRLQRKTGALSTATVRTMEQRMPWFSELSAQERSWIGSVVQAGIKAFIDWYREPEGTTALREDVFGVAPTAFAGRITLQQTVAMIRLSLQVVEANVVDLLGPDDAKPVLEAITVYGREVAFAAAEIYARAAEMRGAWDARLEALVVDSVLRGEADETVESRASALGWTGALGICVVVGKVPHDREAPIDDVRRLAHEHALRSLCAIQGDRLVVVLAAAEAGRLDGPLPQPLVEVFGPGPVVTSEVVGTLAEVSTAAESAMWALRAAPGWSGAPPVLGADDVLPERALAGDQRAAADLVEHVYNPLVDAGGSLLETLQAYLDHGGALEACARSLFVHANTVRYRLKRVADLTHLSPTEPREAFTLTVALTLGRLSAEL